MLRAEEREPAEDRGVRQEFAPRDSCEPDRRSRLGCSERSRLGSQLLVLRRFLCLGFLREDFGSIGFAGGDGPDALAGDRLHFFADVKRLLLARQSSSAACRASISAVNGFCTNSTRPPDRPPPTRSCPQDNRSRPPRTATDWPRAAAKRDLAYSVRPCWRREPRRRVSPARLSISAHARSVLSMVVDADIPCASDNTPIIFRERGSSSTMRIFRAGGVHKSGV